MSRMTVLAISFVLVSWSWFLWSFTQTDPNLYYSSIDSWVHFQNFMWQIPKLTSTWWYVGNVTVSFVLYALVLTISKSISFQKVVVLLAISCWLLAVSNPALSHDLYNYMFNAKAVAIYHQDPHIFSALEIAPNDEWVRFMHNVHTAAPYGRFWTYFSLIPFSLGISKFLTTFLAFKGFMVLGLGVLSVLQWQMLSKGEKQKMFLFLLNPLVLIETLVNGHNDVWMMVLFLGCITLTRKVRKLFSWQTGLALLLLVLSTQIKMATVLLVPVWIGILLLHALKKEGKIVLFLKKCSPYWADICAVLLFIPLLTDRSQQFHPWYLIWALTFVPFLRVSFLRTTLLVFSVTSICRYIPFLLAGEYTDAIQWQMRAITWLAIPVSICVQSIKRLKKIVS